MSGEYDNKFIITTGDIKYDYDTIDFVEGKDINSLKSQAIRLGADGLVFVHMNTYTYETGGTVSGIGSYTSHIENIYYGTAVKTHRNGRVVLKQKELGSIVDGANIDFSIELRIVDDNLYMTLSLVNKESKSIRAVSLDLTISTVWGEDLVFNDLRVYPHADAAEDEYIGSMYCSNIRIQPQAGDIVESIEDATIKINKIIYGQDIGIKPQMKVSESMETDGFWRCPICGTLYSKYAKSCKCGYKLG